MNYKVGDLVKVKMTSMHHNSYKEGIIGVIVSDPVDTPNGFTVRVASGDKVLPMYTWYLEIVDQDNLNTSV